MKEKDILCAVDFSESSMDALKWTFDLARKSQSRVVVMFCYRLITAIDDEEGVYLKKNIEEDAAKKFKEFETQNLKGQPVPYRFIMEVGFYHFRIEMFLKNNSVGLLVIGNSIVQNFDEYKNLGFEKFVRSAQVPVVIVPHEHEEPVQSQIS